MILESDLAQANAPMSVSTPTEFTLYPNPVSGNQFTILNPNNASEEEMHLTITDIAGKMVMNKKVYFIGQQLNVDCNGLSDGVYMVMIGNQRMRLVVTQ
jgi:hypothetical protein